MGRPSRGDVTLAVILMLLSQIDFWLHSSTDSSARLGFAAMVLMATITLTWRATAPLLSAAVCLAALTGLAAGNLVDMAWVYPVLLLSVYSAARHAPPRRAAVALGLALGFDSVLNVYEPWGGWQQFFGNYAFVAFLTTCVPWAAGYAVRRRQVQGMKDATAAVEDERRRIARELHDVVGHALGVIVVQAGAERATLPPGAPASTVETLSTIEQTGRQALGEMRRLLQLLRQHDDSSSRLASPGLGQVETLVSSMTTAGLPTELRVEGEPVPLSPGLDLSAYRIVQESLTNALRHAGPTRSRVTIRYLPDAVELEVLDDGSGSTSRSDSPGFGLAGIRERVALFGGTSFTGSRVEGGYAVRVHLPTNRSDR